MTSVSTRSLLNLTVLSLTWQQLHVPSDVSCHSSTKGFQDTYPPPIWLQKHTDLRAHDFAHSPTCDTSLGSLTGHVLSVLYTSGECYEAETRVCSSTVRKSAEPCPISHGKPNWHLPKRLRHLTLGKQGIFPFAYFYFISFLVWQISLYTFYIMGIFIKETSHGFMSG